MSEKAIKFPAVADPTIEEVLGAFMQASSRRLKPATLRKYSSVTQLFAMYMNDYGSETLDEAETALFEKFYEARGKAHRDFCQVFGPEKIAENVGMFLGYFMPRKVMCGKELLKASGTVTKKLARWLRDEGYLDAESAEDVCETGAAAAKALPAGERLAEALYEYCLMPPIDDWTDEIDDHFTIEKIERGKLYLTPLMGVGLKKDETIILALPKAIIDLCQVGWDIYLSLGKTKNGWRILGSGAVGTL